MKIKKVISVYGNKERLVDESRRELYTYSNKDKKAHYTAPDAEDDRFHVEYVEDAIIDDIDERLLTWNNVVGIRYAQAVGFNASDNDPDRKIWARYVEYVKANPNQFFDKHGDWLKTAELSDYEIRNWIRQVEG